MKFSLPFNARIVNVFLALLLTGFYMIGVVVMEDVTRPQLITQQTSDTKEAKLQPESRTKEAELEPESNIHRLAVMLGGRMPGGLVQGFCVFLFAFSLTEVLRINTLLKMERIPLQYHLLPELEHHELQEPDVSKVRNEMIDREKKGVPYLLVSVIKKCSGRYLACRDASEAQDTLKDLVEISSKRLETELSLLRFAVWCIPIVGMLGTVMGMAGALGSMAELNELGISAEVTGQLYLAYDTTIVALVLGAVVMFLFHRLTDDLDTFMADLQDYVLEHFINRLQKKPEQALQSFEH